MPQAIGVGIPFVQKMGGGEIAATSVMFTVDDAIGLNGTTIPFKSGGNLLVRILGRANTAVRPLVIDAKWNGVSMPQQVFFAESGDGGAFVGIWALTGQPEGTGSITLSCGARDAGCAAIRVGEVAGVPGIVWSDARAGYALPRVMSGNNLLSVGGCADVAGSPFSSPDLPAQWVVMIPAKTTLPNRTKGLAGYFGLATAPAADGVYDIVPKTAVSGVIAAIELRL